jgi:predicted dehydrogenase
MTRLPIGVIGVGALGRHHARHLAALPEAELVGIFDVDRTRARAVAAEHGTRAFDDVDELLGRVEAVSIAVPTVHHAEVGLHVLRRGIPVLMEKPLAGTLAEADALIAMADAQGVQLQVGHIERFNPAVRAAAPYLGSPLYVESQRLAPYQPRGTDVAVVLDLMIHDLDLILHLTGGAEPTDVRASGIAVLSPNLDIANARVEFAGGALDLAAGMGSFLRVRAGWQPGTGGELSDAVEMIPLAAPAADALGLELQSFVHAVRGDREAVVTGREGRAALALALRVTSAVEASTQGAFPAPGARRAPASSCRRASHPGTCTVRR